MAPSPRPRAPSGTVEVTSCHPFILCWTTTQKREMICLWCRSVGDLPESGSSTLNDTESYYFVNGWKSKRNMCFCFLAATQRFSGFCLIFFLIQMWGELKRLAAFQTRRLIMFDSSLIREGIFCFHLFPPLPLERDQRPGSERRITASWTLKTERVSDTDRSLFVWKVDKLKSWTRLVSVGVIATKRLTKLMIHDFRYQRNRQEDAILAEASSRGMYTSILAHREQ